MLPKERRRRSTSITQLKRREESTNYNKKELTRPTKSKKKASLNLKSSSTNSTKKYKP